MLLLATIACAVGALEKPGVAPDDPDDTDVDVLPDGGCTVDGEGWPAGGADPDRTWHAEYDGALHETSGWTLSGDYSYTYAWAWSGGCVTDATMVVATNGGDGVTMTSAYTCDAHDAPVTVHYAVAAGEGTADQDGAWTITYDGDDPTLVSYYEDGDYGASGYVRTLHYAEGRLVQLDHDDGHQYTTTLYEYDGDGNLAVERFYGNGEEWRGEYTWDAEGRLATLATGYAADGAVEVTTTYTYEGDEPFYTDASVTTGARMHQDVDCW